MSYALVTGGSKGIGKEIALLLAQRNLNLILVARSADELSSAQREIEEKYKVKVEIIAGDLSVAGEVDRVINVIMEKNIPLSVLVNNAGYGLWGFFEKLDYESQQAMMNVNITALVKLTYKCLPILKKQSKSYILNVASTAAYQAVPALSVYAASKAFVLTFTRGLRFELKKSNVSVSCLSPGPTDTNFTNRAGMQAMQAVADKFNMKTADVAKIAVKGMFAGKAEIIPGFINVFSVKMIDFLPKSMIEGIAANLYFKHLK